MSCGQSAHRVGRQRTASLGFRVIVVGASLRLRQVALVARELKGVADDLEAALGLADPYHDPGISSFGLENAVWAVGDCFLEVVSPVHEGTTAGRYLERRGGDGGYMAIFQTDDIATARQRVADLGVRIVWQQDHEHIGGTHLHPRDVPGAIVSIDWADPPGSWHWAGPAWSGKVSAHGPGGITGVTVEAPAPADLARRWADALGLAAPAAGATEMELPSGQGLSFVACPPERQPGIVAVGVAVPAEVRAGRRAAEVCGVRLELTDA